MKECFLMAMFLIKLVAFLICYLRTVASNDMDDLPQNSLNKSLPIYVLISIEDVNSIQLVDMDFRLDYYVEYFWNIDEFECQKYLTKLIYRGFLAEDSKIGPNGTLMIGKGKEIFWIPDTYLPDSKALFIPTLPGKNDVLTLKMKQDLTCDLRYELRLATKIACQMDFRLYPYDIQRCPFRFRNHFYPISVVNYNWKHDGVKLGASRPVKLNHYTMSVSWSSYNATGLNGNLYSWLVVNFTFRRQISHFLVHVAGPNVLIVIVAYSSFWIEVDSGPGRFLLTVLTLLSLITQFAGLKGTLPPVSYLSGVDIWMITCMLFVFTAIIELATVNYLHRRRRMIMDKKRKIYEEQKIIMDSMSQFERKIENGAYVSVLPSRIHPVHPSLRTPQFLSSKGLYSTFNPNAMNEFNDYSVIDRSLQVDKVFRIVYPLIFLAFNLVFWPLLMTRKLF